MVKGSGFIGSQVQGFFQTRLQAMDTAHNINQNLVYPRHAPLSEIDL